MSVKKIISIGVLILSGIPGIAKAEPHPEFNRIALYVLSSFDSNPGLEEKLTTAFPTGLDKFALGAAASVLFYKCCAERNLTCSRDEILMTRSPSIASMRVWLSGAPQAGQELLDTWNR